MKKECRLKVSIRLENAGETKPEETANPKATEEDEDRRNNTEFIGNIKGHRMFSMEPKDKVLQWLNSSSDSRKPDLYNTLCNWLLQTLLTYTSRTLCVHTMLVYEQKSSSFVTLLPLSMVLMAKFSWTSIQLDLCWNLPFGRVECFMVVGKGMQQVAVAT